MDDAHEDMVLDRQVTREAFSYAIHEARVRLYTAVTIVPVSLILITVFLFALEPPESYIGTGLVGFLAATPLVRTFIGDRTSESPNKSNNQAT